MIAFILAGGKSSRMGEDKGLKLLNEKSMVEYIIEPLTKVFTCVKIISRNKEYEKFDLPVIQDLIPDKGPIGGIFTALKSTVEKKVFITSCDIPFITEEQIQIIKDDKNENKSIITSFQGKVYPLLGIYNRNALYVIEKHINNNNLKMMHLIQCIPTNIVEINNQELLNINSLQEMKQAEILIKK